MKTIKRSLKELARTVLFSYYLCKCEVFHLLCGMKGISYVVQYMPSYFLARVLRRYGANIGPDVTIDTGITLHRLISADSFKNLTVGGNTHLGHGLLLDLTASIVIGRDVAFGAYCQVWTHTGNWTIDRRDEKDEVGEVHIGDAVICYSGVIISQGTSIGDYSRVGANSLVIRDVEQRTIVGGNPAREIRKISI